MPPQLGAAAGVGHACDHDHFLPHDLTLASSTRCSQWPTLAASCAQLVRKLVPHALCPSD